MHVRALALLIATGISFILMLGPILLVVILSFSPTDSYAFPPSGFSLRWFVEFFKATHMWRAFLFSLEIAVTSAACASILGTMAALFVARRSGALSGILQSLFLAPIVFPGIILGLSLLLFFRTMGVSVLPGLIVAHILLGTPYCFRSTLTSLQSFDISVAEASQSLGAGPIRTFFLIMLPLIWPGVLSGGLFAFIMSFGEANAALFLTGPGYTTLPIEIFSYLQFPGGQLIIASASTIQVALIILMVLAIERIVGLARIVQS
jgi:putative spermidine/putrescine transport system permease protein